MKLRAHLLIARIVALVQLDDGRAVLGGRVLQRQDGERLRTELVAEQFDPDRLARLGREREPVAVGALVDQARADAKANGATEEQVALLEEAQQAGELSWEAYSASVDRFLRCVREAGLRVHTDEVDVHQGLMRRIYGVEVGENLEH